MTIHIAHLYYDLMNLYGESGNVKALKMQLEEQGVKVKVDFLTIQDNIHFDKYDFIYIGMGTEQNQQLVLKHILSYKKEISSAIANGCFFLVTGNAIELFGKSIIANKKMRALNIFHFETKQEDMRIVGEVLATTPLLNKPIIGFQNRSGVMKNIKEEPLFYMQKGTGYAPKVTEEGIIKYHFYGTYIIGPILIRNPELLKYFVKNILRQKDPTFKFKPFHLTLENKAYQNFIQKYNEKS